MEVVTIIEMYSQFIKVASLSQALCATRRTEFLVHTDQHYNYSMLEV